MSTSHDCGLGDSNGMPGEDYQAYHAEKARGGLALTMFGGSSYVASDSTWATGQLNFTTDQVIPFLQAFSHQVHDEGAALMVQLTHLGRRAENNARHWLPTIAPSPIRETLHRSIPREMDRQDIDRVIRQFGEAAYRCMEGGLDGLETMTQGHLIGQFFSPTTNLRTDDFGGSLTNRCRFGLMVHEEIRRRTGDDFIVGMRLGVDETIVDGQDFEDSLAIARVFEKSGLIDFFNANYGRIDKLLNLATDCMPTMASPSAPWLQVVGTFKSEVSLPVFHAARISDIATARHAIQEGLLDMVAMTRAHIADPHLVRKLQQGDEDRIRPCVGATHCMGSARPTCIHNASTGRERLWPQHITHSSAKQRRVVVVGGGPAGLEAARVCAARGHSVTLFEAAAKLGGQVLLAVGATWRKDLIGIVDWRKAELAKSGGVDIRLNRYAEKDDLVALDPDVIIMATGGVPDLDWLPGAEHCHSTWDVLSGFTSETEKAIIYDGTGRHAALAAAEFIARKGTAADLVLLDEAPAFEEAYADRAIWKRRLAEERIPITVEHRLVSVEREGNVLKATFSHEYSSQSLVLEANQVVVEGGTQPASDLYNQLKEQATNKGFVDNDALITAKPQPGIDAQGYTLFRIGDAAASRNISSAIYDALRLCSVM